MTESYESRIYPLNEQALSIELGLGIHEEILARVTNLKSALTDKPFPGLRTMVPAYTTLTIFFDLKTVLESDLKGTTGFDKVSGYLKELIFTQKAQTVEKGRLLEVPVCYEERFAPDLSLVAAYTNLSSEEVIALHTAAVYQVYMIGFVPGFAYLGGMNSKISMPRKAEPRSEIVAGSVGIAGEQTGIYPLNTPGGWQIIGCTPVQLFDINLAEPSYLKAGDQIKFKSISSEVFHHLQQHAD